MVLTGEACATRRLFLLATWGWVMELSLADVAAACGAEVEHLDLDQRVAGWSIDSRTVAPDDLFFAIAGDVHDGHTFVADAIAKGALAAVVQRDYESGPLPVLRVPDTLGALQKTAAFARRAWNGRVVGITGSAGKTATKEITAELLATKYRVAKTLGNFNNHIGLPLSILRTAGDSEIGVFELGMNHAGEIQGLARIAQPQIGVVTNVGYAHVEFFDSIEGVAAAKRELIEALPKDGLAVLNADDERVYSFRRCHRGRTVTFGFSERADVRAIDVQQGEFTAAGARFKTALQGRHSILNILAGLAVAREFGIERTDLVEAVAGLRPAKMRGDRRTVRNITILDDSYNSNPEAARSMIDVLRSEPGNRKIAVLGEMRELGHMAEPLHREIGSYAVHGGVDVLVGVCGAARFIVDEAMKAGLDSRTAFFFEDPESAGDFLQEFAVAGDVVLFKGSRGAHVEKALAKMELA